MRCVGLCNPWNGGWRRQLVQKQLCSGFSKGIRRIQLPLTILRQGLKKPVACARTRYSHYYRSKILTSEKLPLLPAINKSELTNLQHQALSCRTIPPRRPLPPRASTPSTPDATELESRDLTASWL